MPFDPTAALERYTRHAVAEYPTTNGPADYALVVDDKILGIVEAKRLSLGPQNVLVQAERYSRGAEDGPISTRGYRVPFLYSTNGEVVWFQDVRHKLNVSRRVAGFHTPDALRELFSQDFEAGCGWLAANPNDHPLLRPYQIEANSAIEAAIAARKRQMLVAMATGTGKTFTLVNEVYRLMKSEVGRRVLFLVDRRALAAQAVREFASFEAEPNRKFDKIYEMYSQRFQREDFAADERFNPKVLPAAYLKKPKPQHAFVYLCTIQRMAMLDHFDAIKIGLTATPAAHTKAYFTHVVYRYEYSRAVREGYLVDYDVVAVHSDVRMKGVFLKEGDQVVLVDPDTGSETLDSLEAEREFEAPEVERTVTSPDSNRKIVAELKKHTDEHEKQYGRFPKTLIFAANDLPHTSHADQLVALAVDAFGRGQSFVRKITGRADRPLQLIREFRNRPEPGVVVSVDIMSTGVDIPDLEFSVFLRPVKSRILFEQMLGRGTRKGLLHPDKSHFTAFDCFDGTLLAYFRQATAITADPPEKPTRTIKEVIDDIWANRDRAYNVRCLVKRLQRIDKEMAGEGRELFEAHGIADGDLGRYARGLPASLERDFTAAMKLLRNDEFQALLVAYPRRKRLFYEATEYEDTVASQRTIRIGEGREYKPEDYLAAFARFVRENPAKVQAIRILLNRPKGWGTNALAELRKRLSSTPERFTEERLRKAHEAQYNKALVDIISMVKHAAREEEPLLTARERVDRAFRKLTAVRRFSSEQEAWLGRIREHLVANLSIDEDDFESIPVLSQAGGWRNADRAFEGTLSKLIRSINEAIAA